MSGLPVKRAKITAWFFFVMLFLVYMFNADRVKHALSGNPSVVKLPAGFSLRVRGALPVDDLDWYSVRNKFEEGMGIRGRIDRAGNKSGTVKVRVFFRSPDALYEAIETRRSFRLNSKYIIMNFFSPTCALDKGIYTTGLYLKDEAGERFVWLDSFFEKTSGGPVEYSARPVPLGPAAASKDLKFAIEEIGKKDKTIVLKGWAALENAEMDDYSAYLKITDPKGIAKVFYAPLYTRLDIASLYEDIRAANSGFHISVPPSEVAPGKHSIKVIIKSRTTGEVIESMQTETGNF